MRSLIGNRRPCDRERESALRKNVKVTDQPELLKEGDEALQDSVDPVHCPGKKRKVTECCASSGDLGSDLLPPTRGPRLQPHKQGFNGGIPGRRLCLDNSTGVIIKNNSHGQQ